MDASPSTAFGRVFSNLKLESTQLALTEALLQQSGGTEGLQCQLNTYRGSLWVIA